MDIRKRKGFTLIELLVVVAIIALLISILLPSLARARELAKRAVSRANLRGIGQSCYIYANDNKDRFPRLDDKHSNNTSGDAQEDFLINMGKATMVTTAINKNFNSGQQSSIPVSRALFLLIIQGATAPKQFINPSSSDTADDLRNFKDSNERAANPGTDRFDFKGYDKFSYGYQHPFNGTAPPDTDMDVRMALSADKGPWATSGQADDWAGSTPSQGQDNDVMNGITTLDALLSKSNDDWRPYNSQNHNGEGQSVLFVDGHVDFDNKPIVGANQDNIYTTVKATSAANANDILEYMKGNRFKVGTNGGVSGTKYGPLTSSDTFVIP